MKKFTHKLIAMLLCIAMIGGMLPMSVSAESAETEYTLYPTPSPSPTAKALLSWITTAT